MPHKELPEFSRETLHKTSKARTFPSHSIESVSVGRVIAVANQKGGVGKTTTTVNLAASLAAAEQRTLLIDGDPQGNATSGVGLRGTDLENTLYEVLLGDATPDEARVKHVHFDLLDVIAATPDLAGAEIELINRPDRGATMRECLKPVQDEYDFILIDCPPSLGLITLNMLGAAESVLIPLQCEYYALEGLSQLLNTIHRIQHGVNPDLGIAGVLLTMYDARLNLSRQVATDAREYFGDTVFSTIIPRNVRLAEAPGFGKPIILYGWRESLHAGCTGFDRQNSYRSQEWHLTNQHAASAEDSMRSSALPELPSRHPRRKKEICAKYRSIKLSPTRFNREKTSDSKI